MKIYTLHYFCLINLLFFSCSKDRKSYQNLNYQLDEITIKDIRFGYDNNHFTVREVVNKYINRVKNIDQSGPTLNSIIVINPDALVIADSLDKIHKLGKNKGYVNIRKSKGTGSFPASYPTIWIILCGKSD